MNTVTCSQDKLTELHGSKMGNGVPEVCVYEFGKHGLCVLSLQQPCVFHVSASCTSRHADSCKYLTWMRIMGLEAEVTYNMLVFALSSRSRWSLFSLKLSCQLASWPTIIVSISASSSVSQVTSPWLWGGNRLNAAVPAQKVKDLTPLTLLSFPKPAADWVAVLGSPDGRTARSWT